MEVFTTFKNGLILFRKTFIPLFMMTSVFPLFELIIKPSLENYLILNRLTVFDVVSFVLTLLVVAVGYVTLDMLFKTQTFQIKAIIARSVDVLWPLFLFQLIWMIFAGLFSLVQFLPPLVVFLLVGGAIYLSVRVSMTVILIIVERESVAKAFDRSFIMTRGKFWNIFAIFSLLGLIFFSVMIVLFLGLLQPLYQVETFPEMLALLKKSFDFQLIFYVFIMTIMSQIVTTTLYVIYLSLGQKDADQAKDQTSEDTVSEV